MTEPQYHELEEQIRQVVHVPEARPEFVSRLRGQVIRASVPARPRFFLRFAWAAAVVLAVALVVASIPGAAIAIRQLFGFVPGIGLVEQNTPKRVLEAPVAVTRGSITLTLEQVVAFSNRVELAYRADGLPAGEPAAGEQVCSGAEMYPYLTLPDGSRLDPEPMALGGEHTAGGYTAGHRFKSAIPEGVSSATFHLTCLQDAARGSLPEDWVVPFNLAAAGPKQAVGQPLVEGSAPLIVQPAGSDVSFSFLGGAAKEDGIHFFFRFAAQNPAPGLLAVRPLAAYLEDTAGQRIDLINTRPWSPFDRVDVWEYRTALKPTDGPAVLYFEGVQVYLQAQEASFQFAPGTDARVGQTWVLDEHVTAGGKALSVTAARMIELDQHRGFEFAIRADQPEVKISAEVLDMTSTDPRFQVWSQTGQPAPANTIQTGFVYESAVPERLTVTFNTLSVLEPGTWKVEWPVPSQPGK